jgi:hypothetical protein
MCKINEEAADWWAERFQKPELREQFKAELLQRLPEEDWFTYSDYDPSPGILLEAVQAVVKCCGWGFSSSGLLPYKTGMRRVGNRLEVKEGYGAGWKVKVVLRGCREEMSDDKETCG